MDIKIFLTNLGKYNEGELVGEWIDLPVDDDFEQAFEDIGISDEPDENGNYYEEYFITDYEAPFKIGEYDNIYELNEMAEELETVDIDENIFEAILEECGDPEEAIQIANDGDYSVWYCNPRYDGALAECVIDELGMPLDPDYYFDYDEFGRDLRLDGYYDELIDDYRSQGDDEWADDLEEHLENTSDYELAEEYIFGLGGLEALGKETLEMYFDYDSYEDALKINGNFIEFDEGYVELY